MNVIELAPEKKEIRWNPYERCGSSFIIKSKKWGFLKFYMMNNHSRWNGVEVIGAYHTLQNTIADRVTKAFQKKSFRGEPGIKSVSFLKLPEQSDLQPGVLKVGDRRMCGVISRPQYIRGKAGVSYDVALEVVKITGRICSDLLGEDYSNHPANFKLSRTGHLIVTDCTNLLYSTLLTHLVLTGANPKLITMCKELGIDILRV